MNSLTARMYRIGRVLMRTHGVGLVPRLFLALFFLLIRAVVGLGMLLDYVFVPRFRHIRANRPIVIVGNPRTGTTFLQRFLAAEGFGSGMTLFLMLYPSLVLQRLFKPFVPLLEKLSPAKYHSTDVHHTSLISVETDDVAVLFRYLDGLFLYGFFLSFDDEDFLSSIERRMRDTAERDFAWLDALWRRSLVLHGSDRNVAKLFSVSAQLPQFLERFPEAQIVYMVRDPLAVIPSAMSLVIGVLDRAFGFWSKPESVRERWLNRMYQAWIMLFQKFQTDWESGAIDRRRVFVVRYDRMMVDFENVMEEMCAFLGHHMTPEFQAKVKQEGENQRQYQSKHKYDLARFGLSEERILKDCAFYYKTFLPPLDSMIESIKSDSGDR